MDSDQGKLFVGGISWETTEENLRDHFQRYGNIVETVIMKDRNTGRARGFGFVSFADPAAADMALLDKHTINGRLVEAKKAVPRDEQQTIPRSSISSGGQSPGGQGRTKKIFVGGLASTVTEEEFRAYFEQFGTISDAVVMYDHSTQRPRGFGFITFDSEDSVDNVLMKPFHELKDKMVEVKRAIPRDQTPPTKSPANSFSPSAGRGYGQAYPTPGMYGTRPDSRYGAMPAARGAFPYTAGGYPGYAGAGYMMNGSYPGGYPGAYPGAGYGAGYSGNGSSYGNGGGNSPGYASTPSRNGWPAYGGGNQGYGYGAAMWGSATQTPAGVGYYSGENGYGGGSNYPAGGGGGGATRGSGYGSPGGYASAGSGSYASGGGAAGFNYEGYANAGYGEGGWGGEAYNSGGGGGGVAGGYEEVGGGGGGGSAAVESGGYGGAGGGGNGAAGYGAAANRQSQRGSGDARFRPYPAASDRS